MPNDSSYNGVPYTSSEGLQPDQTINNEMQPNAEASIDFAFPTVKNPRSIIKVVGVGGGGSNAVRNMYNEGIQEVSFLVINTDFQALNGSPIPNKLQISEKGLGAGAKPEIARQYALEYENEIRNALNDGTEMVFITAGMGGGTGTGASPVVARIAKELGLLTVGIVTIPFQFEGMDKISMALDGVAAIKEYVDALLVVNNNRLINIYPDLNFFNAFKKADDTLTTAAKSISDIINIEGHINLDFADVRTTLENGGVALISTGEASGQDRVTKAIKNATTSPLLQDNNITNAKHLLFELCFSENNPVSMSEIGELNKFVDSLDKNIKVIWGAMIDNSLGDNVRIILLASGFDIDTSSNEARILPSDQLTAEDFINAKKEAELARIKQEEDERIRLENERKAELERIRLENERKENLKRYTQLCNLKNAMKEAGMDFPAVQAAELQELTIKLGLDATVNPAPAEPAASSQAASEQTDATTSEATSMSSSNPVSVNLNNGTETSATNTSAPTPDVTEPNWGEIQTRFEEKKRQESQGSLVSTPTYTYPTSPIGAGNPSTNPQSGSPVGEESPIAPASSISDAVDRIRKYYGNDAADEMMRDEARKNYFVLNQEDLTNEDLISNLEKLPAYERSSEALEQLRTNTKTQNRPMGDDSIPFK